MGDPKKIRKKYKTPMHPWQKSRIDEEKIILKEYGIKNKKEIWKMQSKLRDFSDRAKRLIADKGPQAEKEKKEMFAKLSSLGLLSPEAGLDDILGLHLRDILERRLQTLVYKKNLAKTMNQARQFIVHGHIKVGDRVVSSPSYVVTVKEEGMISFIERSKLNDPEHPERIIQSESQARKKSNKAESAEKEKGEAKAKPAKKEEKKEPEKSPEKKPETEGKKE